MILSEKNTEVDFLTLHINTVSGEEHDTEFLHAWKEWSQHGKVS